MSWIPVAPDLFLNALYQKPTLLLENLPIFAQLQEGDKLIFRDTGIIEKEVDSYKRSGWGLLNSGLGLFNYAMSSKELEIHRLEKYASAFWFYYRTHVIRPELLHNTVYYLQNAIEGLNKLKSTYDSQGDRKKANIEIVANAIDTFKMALPHIIEQSAKKSNTPLPIYAKNLAFVVSQNNSNNNHIHDIMPLIEDSFHELLQITGDPVFDEIKEIYFKNPQLYTDVKRYEFLAKTLLEKCANLNSVIFKKSPSQVYP